MGVAVPVPVPVEVCVAVGLLVIDDVLLEVGVGEFVETAVVEAEGVGVALTVEDLEIEEEGEGVCVEVPLVVLVPVCVGVEVCVGVLDWLLVILGVGLFDGVTLGVEEDDGVGVYGRSPHMSPGDREKG